MERYVGELADPTQPAIANVITTMQGDADAYPGTDFEAPLPEPLQEPVDFDQHAREAVAKGIFAQQPVAPGLSRFQRSLMPDRPMHRPWASASFHLSDGDDLPNIAINTTRKLLAEASRTILEPELVQTFFDDYMRRGKLVRADAFGAALGQFRPEIMVAGEFVDSAKSFETEIASRKATDQVIHTKEEMLAGLALAQEHPELILTLASYTAIILDYLGEFRAGLKRQGLLDERGAAEMDRYIDNWTTPNFFDAFIPGIAIFMQAAKQHHPSMPIEQLLDGPLFSRAFQFGLRTGIFQNHMTVSEGSAIDGIAHEVKLRCPLAGVISDQLMDGELLDRLHSTIRKQIAEGDEPTIAIAQNVKNKITSWQSYYTEQSIRTAERKAREAAEAARPTVEVDVDDMDLAEALGHAAFMAYRARKPATFRLDGKMYSVDQSVLGGGDSWLGDAEPGDHIFELKGGSYRPGVIASAISYALRNNRPVSFESNLQSYRITPDRARALFADMLTD